MSHKHSAEYHRIYWRRAHAKLLSYQRARHARHRELINREKMKPCVDCGVQYSPWVMTFDHRTGTNKRWTIGTQVARAEKDILVEIAKCDVVCANCHAERTHQQRLDNPSGRKRVTDLTKEECAGAVWVNSNPDMRGRHHNQWVNRNRKRLTAVVSE